MVASIVAENGKNCNGESGIFAALRQDFPLIENFRGISRKPLLFGVAHGIIDISSNTEVRYEKVARCFMYRWRRAPAFWGSAVSGWSGCC
jgi:hypothetical protein